MLRFIWVIFLNLYRSYMILVMRIRANHPEKYSEEDNYSYARYMIKIMQRGARIRTTGYGMENLPGEGGYLLVPNHQGKYDALGIMSVHETPCTVIIDENTYHNILTNEFIDLVHGYPIDKENAGKTIKLFDEVADDLRGGRRVIIFPEGGYTADKKETLFPFRAGSFKLALKSKVPIVPVVLIGSYLPYGTNQAGTVETQVHFLVPIPYEEYGHLRTRQIAELVQNRIQQKIDQITVLDMI